ncbi:MAG TPA: hypothetical protein VNH53_11640 [Sphingomicrobium sp.]|nr:hypothetical protein [Sphingomicrobium sp.]
MDQQLLENVPLILLILAITLIVAFLVLRPRQRVKLSDDTPTRPHMMDRRPPREGTGLAGEAAAAASDVTGEVLDARVHDHLSGDVAADDLQRLKGVGPKFAQLLRAQGIMRFEQIARMSSTEIDRLDRVLGPFSGRIARDRIVEQAEYLARGDIDGFEQRFGKV